MGHAMFSVRACGLGGWNKVGNQVERFTITHLALLQFFLSKILFSLLTNLRNVGLTPNAIPNLS